MDRQKGEQFGRWMNQSRKGGKLGGLVDEWVALGGLESGEHDK